MIAEMIATETLKSYQRRLCRIFELYPSAMKSFQDDWEACVAYLCCPEIHHKRIRTTNLLARAHQCL